MSESEKTSQDHSRVPSQESAEAAGNVDANRGEVEDAMAYILQFTGPRERKLQELAGRRERDPGMSAFDFDLNFLDLLNQADEPLRERDVLHATGHQAVVLTRDAIEAIGGIDFIRRTGERTKIHPESVGEHDMLILYRENLGNEEGKPRLEIQQLLDAV